MKAYIIKTDADTRKLSEILFPLVFEKETGQKVNYKELPRDENGKPKPIGDIYFNISHSGNYWCVLFSDSECGIDIEVERQLNPRITKKILSSNEKPIDNNLLKNWVLKEAYSKKNGAGIGLGFNTIDPAKILASSNISDLSKDDYICYAIGDSPVETLSLLNYVELGIGGKLVE